LAVRWRNLDAVAALIGDTMIGIVKAVCTELVFFIKEMCPRNNTNMQSDLIGWICEEVQNVYYAEKHGRNAEKMTAVTRDAQRSRTPQEPIEFTRDTITFRAPPTTESRRIDERNFALTGQKLFLLSNQAYKRRMIFTNKPLPSEPDDGDECSTYSLGELLGIRTVCTEWDTLISAYKLQLNDVVC
jgi:hypothetical protein